MTTAVEKLKQAVRVTDEAGAWVEMGVNTAGQFMDANGLDGWAALGTALGAEVIPMNGTVMLSYLRPATTKEVAS